MSGVGRGVGGGGRANPDRHRDRAGRLTKDSGRKASVPGRLVGEGQGVG